MIWLAFSAFAAASAALGWGLTSLMGFRLLPVRSAIFQGVVAIAVYPMLAVLFSRAHGSIAAPDRPAVGSVKSPLLLSLLWRAFHRVMREHDPIML